MNSNITKLVAWSDSKGFYNKDAETLKAALRELVTAVDLKASGRAKPETYFSPRMRRAMDEAKALLGDE